MKPSAQMAANAKRGLAWYDEYPEHRGHCSAWMVRFAQTIHADKRMSTIRRIDSWFTDNDDLRGATGFYTVDGDPAPERIAWELLGGDAGRAWSADLLRDIAEEAANSPSQVQQFGFPPIPTVETSNGSTGAISGSQAGSGSTSTLTIEQAADEAAEIVRDTMRKAMAHAVPEFATGPNEGQRPHWTGVLTLEGVETSDRRLIRSGAITWRDLPLTLQDQLLSQPGHDGAVAVGSIASVNRVGQEIVGSGFFDSGEEGQTARRKMEEGTKQGVSVDLTEVEIFLPEDPEEIMEILFGDALLEIISARMAAATLVGIPAFEGARLQVVGDMPEQEALVASGGKLDGLTLRVTIPVESFADEGQVRWSEELVDELSDLDAEELAEITLDASVEVSADTEDAELAEGVQADIDEELATMEVETEAEEAEVLVASGTKAKTATLPPRAWFDEQTYSEPTPKTIEKAGSGLYRIHGHVGLRGSCHIGFTGRCVDVPMGLDYDSFQGPRVPNEVECSNGEVIKAGPVIMDTVHPDLKKSASDAYAFYADTGSLVAQVRCYEDRFGLQIQGWVMPDVDSKQLARFRAADLSPDWRPRATASGGRGVVAILAVPVSGFNLGLVASGGGIDSDPGAELDDIAIVGTNWHPELSAAAQRKIDALDRFGMDVPERLIALAAATEDPAISERKRAALARWSDCGCGGSCCR